ncbi:MAG: penicillin-binding protein 1A [Pandoraea sp.]|nr:MAG: penicillin-binding protein 1A [Pandoraea sp.]TAM18496.1 MAG: penicillin-binding protein 1A [Pandoraea sp.]
MAAQSSSKDPRQPKRRAPLWLWIIGLIAAAGATGALLLGYVITVMEPNLPSLNVITDYRPKMPLRVYTADHVLIGEFGQERRNVVHIQDIPPVMKNAVLAIEDYRFYEHGGVDFIGILRSGIADVLHGTKAEGASTITMQVARNFFLSREKTFTRKLYEMMLSYKIESALTKDQILELYMNQIYLGEGAYGFASAARTYFGVDLKDITLAQAAMLAGLPKAPSAYNPIANPRRAKIRQEYILKRMLDLHYISQAQYEQAINEKIHLVKAGMQFAVHAGYVTEMVRQAMYDKFKEAAYTRGFNVITTIDSKDQAAAYTAVRDGVLAYERRHGYRGPEGHIDLPGNPADQQQAIDDALADHPANGNMFAAVVLNATHSKVTAMPLSGVAVNIEGEGLRFAASALNPRLPADKRIGPGSIIRIMQDGKGQWSITQVPKVEGALVALSPSNGAIRALVGGFDYSQSKFNRVTQAWRQPGSSFKPFIFSAALEKGLGPATIINDAPLNLPPDQTGGKYWDPKDDDQPEGPMTMRVGLEKSKNLVAIRVLHYIGTKYAQDYVTSRFGFDVDKIPPYLPMALGAGDVTPMQMVNAYAVFANGGYRVNPYLISKVTDAQGNVIDLAAPTTAGDNAPRVLDPANAYIMDSMLRSVAQHGTGARSNVLKRTDLAGKTGTTNDARDGWFAGYQHTQVAVAWLGYDQPKPLGSHEFGADVALPIWIDYMRTALQGVPSYTMPMPPTVANIGGELYFADKTPGNGFLASISLGNGNGLAAGMPGSAPATPIGPNFPGGPATAPSMSGQVPNVTPGERQQILDFFKSSKP